MTVLAFHLLQGEISRIRETTGTFPQTLDQIVAGADNQRRFPPTGAWLMDGWRRPIQYVRGDSIYVLISSGNDAVEGTDDDLRSVGPLRKCD